jgi:hypothetical protein
MLWFKRNCLPFPLGLDCSLAARKERRRKSVCIMEYLFVLKSLCVRFFQLRLPQLVKQEEEEEEEEEEERSAAWHSFIHPSLHFSILIVKLILA